MASTPTLRNWLNRGRPVAARWSRTVIEQTRRVGGGVLEAASRIWQKARAADRRYVAGGAAVVAGLGIILAVDIIGGSPGADQIRTMGHMPVASVVFDRHDKTAFTIFQERRHEVPLDAISPNLINAVLAIEDQRFYDHYGLDVWRIAGSMWANVQSGEFSQGGSTITQQLARQSFLTLDKKIRRKLREAYLALRIESMYSKDEILTLYLNKVYFGTGLYGVEAAARGYFNKAALDLSVDEAALIAGLIQSPSAYAPGRNLERAVDRRATVLGQMAAAGMIDGETAREMASKPVTLTRDINPGAGAWFKQAVTRELVDRFGWEMVSQEGLRVFTTLDPVVQAAAESALAEGLDRIEQRPAFRHPARADVPQPVDDAAPDYLQGALVAIDPASGDVRALVGGRDFGDSQFDRVSQAHRQSGSAFKPFVYAAALEAGHSPATLITGLDEPIATPEGPWLPDDGHNTADMLTVRAALRTSSNRAAAQMLQTIGIQPAVAQAKKLGLVAPPVPSLVLGSGDVTLMALTAAYGVFADNGLLHTPRLIRRVEAADGTVLLDTRTDSHQVVSEQTAYQMSAMLADVIDRGTGAPARQTGFRQPAAGKTGTTNDYRDAWFIGFTADLVAGVWVGFDKPRTIVSGGYASELAVPIWGSFMRDATAGTRSRWLTRPAGVVAVEICQESGLLPNAACSRVPRTSDDGDDRVRSTVAVEYFRRGHEPREHCPLHDSSWFRGVQTAAFNPGDFPASALAGAPAARGARPEGEETVAAVAEAGSPAVDDAATEPRRGFWSRVAGAFRGGNRERERPRPGGGAR
jgi:1A family penicillin-binding protein